MSLLNTNLHKHRPHGLAKNTFENLNNAFLKINMQYIKVIQEHYCEKTTIAQINSYAYSFKHLRDSSLKNTKSMLIMIWFNFDTSIRYDLTYNKA